MKILHVIGSVDRRGGGTTDHVYSTARVWSRLGHQCEILCLDSPGAAAVLESDFPTVALGNSGCLHDFFVRALPITRYGYTSKLTKWLRANAKNYDAIVLNGLWNYTSVGCWRVLRGSRIPYYICPHGMLDPWLKRAAPFHHWVKVLFWHLLESKVARDASGFFFACEEERRLAQYFLRGSTCPEYVIPYGAQDIQGNREKQKAAFVAKFPKLRDRKLILFLSRIHPKKGLDLLLQAFASLADKFADFDLVIAGPDQVGLAPSLKKRAAELGIDKRIHWTGMLVGDEKWGAFRSSSLFVLPSHQENFGIAVAEAMALAVPVLITNKVNIWQEVEASGAGYVTEDRPEDISKGLHYLCSLSETQLAAMGKKGRECFVERFSLEKNAAEFLEKMQQGRLVTAND